MPAEVARARRGARGPWQRSVRIPARLRDVQGHRPRYFTVMLRKLIITSSSAPG